MKEYIEREEVLNEIETIRAISDSLPNSPIRRATLLTVETIKRSLIGIPAADVREVVRGEWIHMPADGKFRESCVCSVCGKSPHIESWIAQGFNACPYCFANMRG